MQNRKKHLLSQMFVVEKRINKFRGLSEDLKETEAAEIVVLQTKLFSEPKFY